MAANEASAVGSVRTINTAVTEYSLTYGGSCRPNLVAAGGTGTAVGCNAAGLIDSVLSAGVKSGYNVALIPGTQAAPASSAPDGSRRFLGWLRRHRYSRGRRRRRSAFCSDASGVIRSNPTGAVSYTSPVCNPTQAPPAVG